MNFISQLTPELRNALLKLQNIQFNESNELNESELEKIAEQIVDSEVGDENESELKFNLSKTLTSIESGLYAVNMTESDINSLNLGSKGLPNNTIAGISVSMLKQLINLGIIESDGKKILNFDADLASRILDTEVTSWSDFTKQFCENSYSYLEDLEGFSDANLRKYFVGPLLQYSSQDDVNNNNYSDLRYVLNFDAILKDFAHYPGWIETPQDLLSAIQWKSQSGTDLGVNGKIDEDVYQGYLGDCWLLSGVLALASSEDGAKAISDAIKVKTLSDGTQVVEVEFKGALDSKGIPVKITITAEEIAKYDSDLAGVDLLSAGDNDMLVLELAANKLEEMLRNGEAVSSPELSMLLTTPDQFDYRAYSPDYINSFLEGSDASRMIYLLTGAIPDYYFDNLTRSNIYQILQNAAENPETVISFGLYEGDHTAKTIDGGTYNITLEGGHAFAVTDVQQVLDSKGNVDDNNSTVTFINPWDSSEKITVSWKEFVNLDIGSMSSTSLNEQIEGTTDKPESSSPYESGKAYTGIEKIEMIAEEYESGNLTVKQLISLLIDIDIVEDVKVKYDKNDTVVTIIYDDGKEMTLTCNTKAVNDGLKGLNGNALSSENQTLNSDNKPALTQKRYIWLNTDPNNI